MIYKLRVILDIEEDVFRDIEVDSTASLMDLNDAVKNAFLMEGEELSAFYKSDDEWSQGEEVMMEDMTEEGTGKTMYNTQVEEMIDLNHKRMLYVYDFLDMWTFFIELLETKEGNLEYPTTVYIYGEKPKDITPKDQATSNLEHNFIDSQEFDEEDYEDYEDDYEIEENLDVDDI